MRVRPATVRASVSQAARSLGHRALMTPHPTLLPRGEKEPDRPDAPEFRRASE